MMFCTIITGTWKAMKFMKFLILKIYNYIGDTVDSENLRVPLRSIYDLLHVE